jgi:hypothetical protein
MRYIATSLAVAGSLGLAACAVAPPPGPSFAAMPGPGKTFDQFQADNARCQQVGVQASGPVSPAQAANQSQIGSAVVGTALGAAAGAAIGAAAGGAGVGAAIGAGTGLLAGTAVGAGNAQASAAGVQRAYDIAYAQCMAAAGEKVPDLTAGYPAGAYPAYGYGYPAYGYPYYPYYGYYGAPVAVGVGWGWGGGWGWHGGWGWGGGWHGGWGGHYWH